MQSIERDMQVLKDSSMVRDMNPWLEMSQTDRSGTNNLRSAVFNTLGITDQAASCWLSGGKPVKVAHILPCSTKAIVREKLGLTKEFRNDNVDASRWNFMVLRNDIESAFDRLKVSFLPMDAIHQESFRLHIWDKGSVDADLLLLDGKPLQIPTGVSLSRRALSYQAICAFVEYKKRADVGEINLNGAPRALNAGTDGTIVYTEMMDTLRRSIREENQEEYDDDDDDDDDGDEQADDVDPFDVHHREDNQDIADDL
jgi:hypothetical protein